MEELNQFNTILVPTDFSPMSRVAFERALELVAGDEATVVVLHVVDSSIADFVAKHELATTDHVIECMKDRA